MKYRKGGDIRGILPAGAADEYMLGHANLVARALQTALARGYLRASDGTQAGKTYIRVMNALLRKTGYVR